MFRPMICAIAALPLALAACSTSPATGRTQFTGFLPQGQEAALGAQEHEKVMAEFGGPLQGHPDLVDGVQAVGERLVPHTERTDVTYTFTTLDSPVVNAFALPGGYVYITRGLLALTNSEAEVAAVLGHEIGHVTDRHTAERYSRGVLAQILAAGVGIATESKELATLGAAGAGAYIAGFSRDQERTADQLGMRYMTRAGYNPSHMAGLLDGLARQQELAAALEGKEASEQSSMFRTHPLTSERIERAQATAASYAERYAEGDLENARGRWLKTLDGMIYGDSPAQGFVRGQQFIHPVMRFKFSAPDGYSLTNGATEVLAQDGAGSIVMFDFDSKISEMDIKRYIASKLGANMRGDVQAFAANGLEGAWGETTGTVNDKPYRLRLVGLRDGDQGRVWRFMLAVPTSRNNTGAELNRLMAMPKSFETITQAEADKIRPHRIKVTRAGKRDTEETMARKMPYGDKSVLYFRALNATEPGQPLKEGRLYKIIVE